jgi:hypothetical protein
VDGGWAPDGSGFDGIAIQSSLLKRMRERGHEFNFNVRPARKCLLVRLSLNSYQLNPDKIKYCLYGSGHGANWPYSKDTFSMAMALHNATENRNPSSSHLIALSLIVFH